MGYLGFKNLSDTYIKLIKADYVFGFANASGTEVVPIATGSLADQNIPPSSSAAPIYRIPVKLDKINTNTIFDVLKKGLTPFLQINDIRYTIDGREYNPLQALARLERRTFTISIVDDHNQSTKYFVSPKIVKSRKIYDVLSALPLSAEINNGFIETALGRRSDVKKFEEPRSFKRADLSQGMWILSKTLRDATDNLNNAVVIGDEYSLTFVTKRDILAANADRLLTGLRGIGQDQFSEQPVTKNGEVLAGAGFLARDGLACLGTDKSKNELLAVYPGTKVRLSISTTLLQDMVVTKIPRNDYPSIPNSANAKPVTQAREYWQQFPTISAEDKQIIQQSSVTTSGKVSDYGVNVRINPAEGAVDLDRFVSRNGRVANESAGGSIFVEFTIDETDVAGATKSGEFCLASPVLVSGKADAGRVWSYVGAGGAVTPGMAKFFQQMSADMNAWQREMPRKSYDLLTKHISNIDIELLRPLQLPSQ